MDRTAEEFIAIVRASLGGAPLPAGFAVGDGAALFSLASRQELAHLLHDPLAAAGALDALPEEIRTAIGEARLRAIQRVALLTHEQGAITAVLDRLAVPYVLLKGAALRELWPAAWMRTSCDLDILIHPEDAPRAAEALTAELGYRVKSLGHHDHSLYAPSGVHLELHFSLLLNIPADRVLCRVWETAEPSGEGSRYIPEPALISTYLLAHHASHLLAGGGGLRPVLDFWYALRAFDPDAHLLDAYADSAGLLTFAFAVTDVGRFVFEGAPLAEVPAALCDWLLAGGIYGNADRRAALRKSGSGGRPARRARRRYVIGRLFPSRSALSVSYPVLRRAPVLLPFVWCHRWLSLLFGGRLRVTARRLRAAANADPAATRAAADLLAALDLTLPDA